MSIFNAHQFLGALYKRYIISLPSINLSRTQKANALSQASWARKSEASSRSHISDRASLISSVPGGPDGDVRLTPQQYGVLGK
ncbi:hypothetical protein WN51_04031 [Melipona quadrifasciata]|uniref:Uncharacterized protein n=1 Tax=Melipona quadrifasciata TaxID=166423 RepID=A0A0M8ZPP2_9HYME|nr:hypothetical protein WN51_04031 [Melipona quadrifasciata]